MFTLTFFQFLHIRIELLDLSPMNYSKLFIIGLIILGGCSRLPLEKISDAMKPVDKAVVLKDQLTRESFFEALKTNLDTIKNSTLIKDQMIFGKKIVSKKAYTEALEKILLHEDNWINYIDLKKNDFDYEVP